MKHSKTIEYVPQWEVGRHWQDIRGFSSVSLITLKSQIQDSMLLKSSDNYRIIKRTITEEVVKLLTT